MVHLQTCFHHVEARSAVNYIEKQNDQGALHQHHARSSSLRYPSSSKALSVLSPTHNFTQSHKTNCLHVRNQHVSHEPLTSRVQQKHSDTACHDKEAHWPHSSGGDSPKLGGPNDCSELQPHDSYCLGYLGHRGLNLTVLARLQSALFKSETSHLWEIVLCRSRNKTLEWNYPLK